MTSLHQTNAWRKLALARVALGRANDEPCGICGGEIQYTLSGRTRMGPTADHPMMLQLGGELLPPLSELQVAHRRCNSRNGTRVMNALRKRKPVAAKAENHTPNGLKEGGRSFVGPDHDPAAQSRTTLGSTGTSPRRARKWPKWFPEDLRSPPDDATWPRLETPHHPNAVGTYGDLVWKQAATYKLTPRWWQAYACARLLEHDADGQLCWLEAAVSTARQSGKGAGLIRPLAEWRMNSAELFGEVQTVLHLSAQVNTVMEIAAPSFAHHRKYVGSRTRLTNGEQMIQIEDSSRWLMRSTTGAYGFSVSMAMIDEVWDVQPRVVDSMVSPTMVERISPQLLMTSTANARCTPTYPTFAANSGVEEDRLLLEWSAPPEAKDDAGNRRYWRMAAPHYSPQRERLMARQLDKAGRADFITNWLNVWFSDATTDELAVPNWSALPVADPEPDEGGIVCLDETRDGSRYAVVRMVDDSLWFHEFHELTEAVAVANTADEVVVGIGLADAATAAGLQHRPIRFGVRELAAYTPLLRHRVAAGDLRHDHNPEVAEQAAKAVVVQTEQGAKLSAKKSFNEIHFLKLSAWACGFSRAQSNVAPMIYR